MLLSSSQLLHLGIALSLALIGYFFALKSSHFLEKILKKRYSRHLSLLLRRMLFYAIFLVFLIMGLQNLGINVSVFLGAAGIFTVALSFAAQTAFSNLISGIFLLFERPFKIGDLICVQGLQGTVESIDLLSTKLTTPDQQLLRIPNETLIKSPIFNVHFFAQKKIELIFQVDFQSDLPALKDLIYEAIGDCPQLLAEPKPEVVLNQFFKGLMEIKVSAWAKTKELTETKVALQEAIQSRLNAASLKLAIFI